LKPSGVFLFRLLHFTRYHFAISIIVEERRTVYFSKTITPFTQADLTTIFEQSKRRNAEANISGVLLYVRGSIIQVLEGETQAIEVLFNRIQIDQRHTEVTRVSDKVITKRLFPDWTMGYETITNRQMEGINAILEMDRDYDSAPTVIPGEHIILRLLRTFYQSNRYN